MVSRSALILLAALLGACGSTPRPGAGPGSFPDSTGAPPPLGEPAPYPPLQGEQRWLEEWFRGTPVVIGSEADGSVRIDVPLRNSFDPGKVDIKPALDALLVRVAASMRRQPAARVHLVVPRDPKSDGALSIDRGDKVVDRLATLGIAPQRVASVLVGAPTVMQLRLVAATAAMPPAAR